MRLALASLLGGASGALMASATWIAVADTRARVLASGAVLRQRTLASMERALRPFRLAGAEGRAPPDRERRRLQALSAAVALPVGVAFGGVKLSLALAACSAWLSSRVLVWRRDRYRVRLEAGAAGAALAIADGLAGGKSIRGALTEAKRGLTGPVGAELERLGRELELGAATDGALERLCLRCRSRRIDLIVAAVRIQRRSGGGLATLLRRIAVTLEEQDQLRDEARAATAQARFTSRVVLALPLFGLVLAELALPGFVARLAGSFAGLWLLGSALLLQISGMVLIARLSRVDS